MFNGDFFQYSYVICKFPFLRTFWFCLDLVVRFFLYFLVFFFIIIIIIVILLLISFSLKRY